MIERISSRRVCGNCGAIYSTADAAHASPGCATCAATTPCGSGPTTPRRPSGRACRPTTEQTAPLIEWFRATDQLVVIDGDRATEAVTADVIAAVDARLAG